MKLYKNKLLIIKGKLEPQIGKLIVYKGQIFSIVPWTAASYRFCKHLNLKGLPAPSTGYDFTKCPYSPYTHQLVTVDFLLANVRAFCWNEAGTGKTASCLWAYDYLRQQNDLTKILIICPLSTTLNVWGIELFKIIPRVSYGLLIGSRERRIKLLDKNLDAYIINHDGIKILTKELTNWQPDLVIADEHTAFKNQRTHRTKALATICKKAKRVWMLSGTPSPQSPTDLYAPARIICPDLIGRSFIRFRDLVMQQVSMYQWTPREGFEQVIKATVQPAIRFTRDECLDLPDVVTQTYEVPLSKKQELAYKDLRKEAFLMMDEKQITAVNEGVMRTKLLQCCSGYLYDINKDVIDLHPRLRLEALQDIIKECSRGVLVFMSFRSSIVAVEKYLKRDYKVRVINGDTSVVKRNQYFQEFQEGKIKVLLAHPKTMGHGVTLTHADTVVWYLVTSDNELYQQANSRIQRIGQEHKMRVIHIVSTQLEYKILERLEQKKTMQGVLLETLKQEE